MEKKISFKEKIFVAGASGMVGSSIYRMLIKCGYGEVNGGVIFKPNRKELNLLDINSVKSWFSHNQPTVLIIAAAKVGGILANSSYPTSFLLDNLKIQTNLLEAAKEYNLKRVLFLGSSCIYPKFAKQPIKEEYLLTGSLESSNQWYALAKITGIKICEAIRIEHQVDAISLMPTNLYGPGDNYHLTDSHVIAALIRKFYEAKIKNKKEVICWGSGQPLREFLHVDDLASAVIFALEKWDPNSPDSPVDENGNKLFILNVGTGKDISIKDLAYLIKDEINFSGDIKWDKSKPDGTPRKLLNVDRIKNLGWSPKIDLKEGIKETIKCFTKDNFENKLRF